MNAIENNALVQQINAGTGETPPQTELGQEAFLELMIAQFRNQDPFEPMTNGEFLSQLAQFGTVSGVQELQGAFDGLASAISSDQALSASNLVGHDVLARSELANLASGNTIRGAVEVQGASETIEIDVTDASGQLVRTLSLGPQSGGLVEFEWDGLDADGDSAATGVYQLTARVLRGGRTETVGTLIRTEVESVSIPRDGRGIRLNTAEQGALLFSDVDRIL